MDVTDPSLHFSFFSFLVKNKENQLFFNLFFSLVSYPKSIKTQVEKANFYRVFPVSGTLLQAVPPGDGQADQPESLSAFRLAVKAYLPGPLIKGSTQRHCKATTKPPHLETFLIFEKWNLITSWFSSSCPST